MIDITIKSHIGVVVSSIDKIYKKAKLNGKLEIQEIYYLNIIYKLLTKLDLTNEQNNELIGYYNKLSFYSQNICSPKIIKKYQTTLSPNFQQAEFTDCNNSPVKKLILYWQELFNLSNSNIRSLVISTGHLTSIASDTYAKFEIGKDIEYSLVGKIVFLALESNTTNYIVKDQMNNDVTHTFSITLVPELNATLFISDNIYAHGVMNFKIIKQ